MIVARFYATLERNQKPPVNPGGFRMIVIKTTCVGTTELNVYFRRGWKTDEIRKVVELQ